MDQIKYDPFVQCYNSVVNWTAGGSSDGNGGKGGRSPKRKLKPPSTRGTPGVSQGKLGAGMTQGSMGSAESDEFAMQNPSVLWKSKFGAPLYNGNGTAGGLGSTIAGSGSPGKKKLESLNQLSMNNQNTHHTRVRKVGVLGVTNSLSAGPSQELLNGGESKLAGGASGTINSTSTDSWDRAFGHIFTEPELGSRAQAGGSPNRFKQSPGTLGALREGDHKTALEGSGSRGGLVSREQKWFIRKTPEPKPGTTKNSYSNPTNSRAVLQGSSASLNSRDGSRGPGQQKTRN